MLGIEITSNRNIDSDDAMIVSNEQQSSMVCEYSSLKSMWSASASGIK